MKKYLILLLIVGLFRFMAAESQPASSDTSIRLQGLFNRLAAGTSDAEKLRINDSIINIIDKYVRSDTVLKHKFRNIRYLGQISTRDSKLKIVTWNLILHDSKSRYYCYFINGNGKHNSVYKLTGPYREEPVRSDTVYSMSDWYGALYYDIRPLKKDNQLYWILLGVDFGNPTVTRKIIDVMSFTPGGDIVLGKKWFTDSGKTNYRVVIEYSSDAVVSLKFLSDKSIVFDHLVPFASSQEDSREHYGPEYSFDGYSYEKGMWKFRSGVNVKNKK